MSNNKTIKKYISNKKLDIENIMKEFARICICYY